MGNKNNKSLSNDTFIPPIVVTTVMYLSVSAICLRNPRLVFWQKPKQWNSLLINSALFSTIPQSPILNIGHRGGCRGKLENTIESFDYGLHCGANVLEMDVCLTKDKQIVVIHDNSLLRLCGVDKQVEEFNYKDLPRLLTEIPYDFSVNGKYYTKDC